MAIVVKRLKCQIKIPNAKTDNSYASWRGRKTTAMLVS